ncbi:hypothetical protein BS47DRAFT_1338648, partial [Hydnum rufescens UP504]
SHISRPIPPPIYTCLPYGRSPDLPGRSPHHRDGDGRSSSSSAPMMLPYPSSTAEHQATIDPKSPLPVSHPSGPIISIRGMMCVYHFDPKEGEPNLPLTVRLDFQNPYARDSSAITLRIMFGDVPLPTSMQSLISTGAHPLLSVQVTHGQDILDSVDIGNFAYWCSTSTDVGSSSPEAFHNSPYMPCLNSPYRPPKLERDSALEGCPHIRAPPGNLIDPPRAFAPAAFGLVPSPAPPPPASPTALAPPQQSPGRTSTLIRTSQLANGHGLVPHQTRINLVIKGELNSVTMGWSQEDFNTRRRLVQFWRRQDRNNLHLAFSPISPEDFQESSIVISCIFREETDECYITSVDIIFLLECLVANRFTVEEKNRIRRNLEGFKPQTVSKNKKGQEDFFTLIMSFPNPRPRNIEKDVKVFPWKLLQKALEKIVNKYSYLPASGTMVEDGRASSASPVKENPREGDNIPKPEESTVLPDRGFEQMYPSVDGTPSTHFMYSVKHPSVATYPRSPSSSVQSHTSTSAAPTQSRKRSASNYSSSLLDLPPQSSGAHRAGFSTLGGALDYNPGGPDHEVGDLFNATAGYMGTAGGNSPPSELDGIHGRSFHHQLQQQQHREHQSRAPSTLQQSRSQFSQTLSRPSSSMHQSYTSYYSPDGHHAENSNEGLTTSIHRSNPPLYAPTPNTRRSNITSLMLPGNSDKNFFTDVYTSASHCTPPHTRTHGNDGQASGTRNAHGGARDVDIWVPISDPGFAANGSSPGIDPNVGVPF